MEANEWGPVFSPPVNIDCILSAFGHLVRTNEKITAAEFTARILTNYDNSEPKTAYLLDCIKFAAGYYNKTSRGISWLP